MPIRTVIVDDERPARDELQFLLRSFPEIEVIAQGKNGLEALALILDVAAILTAIVKINKISAFRKWLAPFKRGGPFAFSILGPSQSKTLRNSLCACGLNK